MNDYPVTTWRLIRSRPADGATNMAIDEAILRAVARREVCATLRLYSWDPPCLSLGRGQVADDVDCQAVEDAGYGLVRRPTGGRAILHIDELTYSVAVCQEDPRVTGSVVESYRRLSAGLVRAMELLGVPGLVADQRADRRGDEGPVCFEVPSDYEITACGRKLVGSAQMRAQGAVLQHGTVPLHGDIARICPLLAQHPDQEGVRDRATTVARARGWPVEWEDAAEALAEGFEETLNVALLPAELTAGELVAAQDLREQKYGTSEWTSAV